MSPPLPRAVAVVITRADEVLLIRRALDRPLGGFWTPVTGRLEPGEALEAACHREVLEEVGLTITLGPSFHHGTTSDGRFELTYFLARYDAGELCLQSDEVMDARWLDDAGIAATSPMLATTRGVLASRPRGT